MLLLLAPLVSAQSVDERLGPADPAAPVPILRYESPFTRYRASVPTPPLPWRALFDAGGEFAVPAGHEAGVEVVVRKPVGGHADHGQAGRQVSLAPAAQAPSGSDTRARVESINRADGKVKLKHGPIPKLDMPAMTMVFRVADAALLDQVTEGEEVGVTVEKIGSAYVVTGVQR